MRPSAECGQVLNAQSSLPLPARIASPNSSGGLMRGLTGKRVLITGGASGIGAATAARFLEEGSAVCVLDRDNKARARIEKKLPDLAGSLEADVSDLEQVQLAFDGAVRIMGGVDVLINNAGISI